MNMEQEERLKELYEQGLTSIEEERVLIRNHSASGNSRNLWFDYIRFKRKLVPSDIEMQVWEKVKSAQQRQRRIFASVISAAASVLIISVLITTNLSSDEKAKNRAIIAAFEEALSMIPDNSADNTAPSILYEDESIIIYIEK